MKLFSKIYTYLLLGMISLLIIDGNLNYEAEIKQFDLDMANNATEIGKIMSGIISHAWQQSGQLKAIELIEDANHADQVINIRWVWIDDMTKNYPGKFPQLENQNAEQDIGELPVVSFVLLDDHREKLRYTFVPVAVPGDRAGAIQLTQSLAPLAAYTQKMLIRSLVITSLLAIISGIIIYFFIHTKIRKPLDKLSRKAVEIGKGNLEANLEIKGDDELVSLAKIMNDMCTRLLIAQEKIRFENLARLKTMEQLRHTEKLSTIGQIAAGIAHEIGTPLNVVDGRAKMIISEPLEKKEIIDCAQIIKTQAERMTLIIRQLLDFSRKKKSELKANENITNLIRQVVSLLSPVASKQGVSLSLKAGNTAQMLSLIDAQQIQQVLMNIIMNAIQATAEKGHVVVEAATITLRSMLHTDDQLQEFIRIDINDEGEGIPQDNLQEIFTPFFTTKKVGLGTGLGLSIAQELLEEHGGWIEVENRAVRGSRFSIFLKLEQPTRENG